MLDVWLRPGKFMGELVFPWLRPGSFEDILILRISN